LKKAIEYLSIDENMGKKERNEKKKAKHDAKKEVDSNLDKLMDPQRRQEMTQKETFDAACELTARGDGALIGNHVPAAFARFIVANRPKP